MFVSIVSEEFNLIFLKLISTAEINLQSPIIKPRKKTLGFFKREQNKDFLIVLAAVIPLLSKFHHTFVVKFSTNHSTNINHDYELS